MPRAAGVREITTGFTRVVSPRGSARSSAQPAARVLTCSRGIPQERAIAANEVTPETIGRISVRLHRVKDRARTDRLGNAPLALQSEREVRPVPELVGLPASVRPEAIEERGARTPSMPR